MELFIKSPELFITSGAEKGHLSPLSLDGPFVCGKHHIVWLSDACLARGLEEKLTLLSGAGVWDVGRGTRSSVAVRVYVCLGKSFGPLAQAFCVGGRVMDISQTNGK